MKLVLAKFVAEPRTKSDKYAASGAEMEKLLKIENKLLFKIEHKITEIPNPPNSLVKNHAKNLRKALTRIESERNLSKLLSFVYEQQESKPCFNQSISTCTVHSNKTEKKEMLQKF